MPCTTCTTSTTDLEFYGIVNANYNLKPCTACTTNLEISKVDVELILWYQLPFKCLAQFA